MAKKQDSLRNIKKLNLTPLSHLKIRKAKGSKDIKLFYRKEIEAHQKTYSTTLKPYLKFRKVRKQLFEESKSMIKNGETTFLMDKNTLAASYSWSMMNPKTAMLKTIAVYPSYQGRGISWSVYQHFLNSLPRKAEYWFGIYSNTTSYYYVVAFGSKS